MKIELRRIDDAYHMEATNEMGNIVHTDGSEKIGGGNKSMRPMQLMLVGLGSCSSIDVIHLLNKQKQDLQDIKITVSAEREEGKTPSLFTKIKVHYKLFGPLDVKKVERALSLSMDKLCSVAKIIEKTAEISWDYEIINTNHG